MADFTQLKNSIQAKIKSNGKQEITGDILQESMIEIVDQFNVGLTDDLNKKADKATVSSILESINDLQRELGNCVTDSELAATIAQAITTTLNTEV